MADSEQKKLEMIANIYNGVKGKEFFFVPVAQMPDIKPEDYENEQTRIVFEMLMMPDTSKWFAVFTDIDEYNASGYEQGIRIYYGEMIRAALMNDDMVGLYINPYRDGVQINKAELLEIFKKIAEEGE